MAMIKVETQTHKDAKKQAKDKGMTLQGYIKYLVNKDK
jgi:hypothetical protein